jgi:hypothetical protein
MPHSVKPGNDDKKAEEFIAGATLGPAPAIPARAAPAPPDDDAGKTAISLRFDTRLLGLVDSAAKRLGMSRTAWLHLAAGERLGEDRR